MKFKKIYTLGLGLLIAGMSAVNAQTQDNEKDFLPDGSGQSEQSLDEVFKLRWINVQRKSGFHHRRNRLSIWKR